MRELSDIPTEDLPTPRRTLLEWLYDWLIPPTQWEAEGRYLRLQIAERVRVRTALQERRTREMEARKWQREADERELLDGAVQHGVFNLTFLDSGVEYLAVVALEELVNRGNVRQLTVRSVSRTDKCFMAHSPSEELLRSRIQADHKYIKFARPWKDGQLSTEALRKLMPAGFVFPEVSLPEPKSLDQGLLLAELERLNNKAILLADQLRAYADSRSVLDYIAQWERANGTLACIMSEEVQDFVAGLQRAASKSSARTTVDILQKQNSDHGYTKSGKEYSDYYLDLHSVEGTTRKIPVIRVPSDPEISATSAILNRLRNRRKEENDYV